VAVIGEVFYFFVYYFIIIIIIHFFFVFHKPTTGSPGGIGFAPYPHSVKAMHPELCGDVTDNGVGGIMEPGGWSENNKCLGL